MTQKHHLPSKKSPPKPLFTLLQSEEAFSGELEKIFLASLKRSVFFEKKINDVLKNLFLQNKTSIRGWLQPILINYLLIK